MLKKTITYTDYDGVERTEDFYFNLTKAELVKLQFVEDGGLEKMIQKIINERDNKRILALIQQIILMAYGEKSADGKRFIKKENGISLSDNFEQCEAYSVLFMEFLNDSESLANFINGIMPQDLVEKSQAQLSMTNA